MDGSQIRCTSLHFFLGGWEGGGCGSSKIGLSYFGVIHWVFLEATSRIPLTCRRVHFVSLFFLSFGPLTQILAGAHCDHWILAGLGSTGTPKVGEIMAPLRNSPEGHNSAYFWSPGRV